MLRLIKSVVLLSLMVLTAIAATPKVGEKAPPFSLPSASGATVALKIMPAKPMSCWCFTGEIGDPFAGNS